MDAQQARKIRLKLDLTQKEMGNKIGVSWQSISGYENGESIPQSIQNLYKLIDKYEC